MAEVSTTDTQEIASRNIVPQLTKDLSERESVISTDIKAHQQQIKNLTTERLTVKRMIKALKG